MSTLIYIPAGLQTPELEILSTKVQNSINARGIRSSPPVLDGKNTRVHLISTCYGAFVAGENPRTREGSAHLEGKWIHVTAPATIEPRSYSHEILKNHWEARKYQHM